MLFQSSPRSVLDRYKQTLPSVHHLPPDIAVRLGTGLLQPVHTQMYYKRFISDGIAVRRTVRRAGRQRCLAVQVTHAGHTQHLSVSVPSMRQQHRHIILVPSARHKSGDVDCSPRGAQPPRCPRRLRARLMVWRCSAVLVDLSRGRRCNGDGRAR